MIDIMSYRWESAWRSIAHVISVERSPALSDSAIQEYADEGLEIYIGAGHWRARPVIVNGRRYFKLQNPDRTHAETETIERACAILLGFTFIPDQTGGK